MIPADKLTAEGDLLDRFERLIALDIIRVHAEDYLGIGEALERIRTKAWEHARDPATYALITEDDLGWALSRLDTLRHHCSQLRLDVSLTLLNGIIARLNNDMGQRRIGWERLSAEVAAVSDAISTELSRRVLIFMPPERASWFYGERKDEQGLPVNPPFGGTVHEAFPSADDEIWEACRCFALARDTACIFHLMRVLESGLRCLARTLLIGLSGGEAWQNVIDLIEAQIRELQKSPRGPKKQRVLQFCSEAAKEFVYFKDAWRNHVMHSRATYGVDESTRILGHVRDFMVLLAENGIREPKKRKARRSIS